MTSTYIINRLPSKFIENKNPFEIVFKQNPTYKYTSSVFVCYPQGQEGYRVYDVVDRKINVSRDVFIENNFPFKNMAQEIKDDEDMFPNIVDDEVNIPEARHENDIRE